MPPRKPLSGESQTPRERYAEELRTLRERKGITLRALGEIVHTDHSHLGHMEHGKTVGGPELARALDNYYGATHLLILWDLAKRDPSQFRERYQRYMSMEANALTLWHYAVSAPSGLLQTGGYAEEYLAAGGLAGEELQQQVEARLSRQAILSGTDAAHFRAILSEAVLRTPLRDAEAWQAQLEFLADSAERPNVALQVLPQGAGLHRLMNTDVMFLRLVDGRTVAYVEDYAHNELIEETSRVERLQRAYDAVRDMTLSPAESKKVILQTLEEARCEPST
ncbi:helix-turn-helix domain-containing protein [Streptomyces sp. NA04227]|uniref:helix-turn-helix domain-containing protein n=1 Tax=Streptomyces sp. NA04227 TaxID=2742136 RepID=UPI0015907074|nr:helix-turn-helix transcriptional regulator [Streptomyces sp. NA04227]QKW06370.1 helix-turn-helix domain-containing protein [Streptomyces sp. NA04227]